MRWRRSSSPHLLPQPTCSTLAVAGTYWRTMCASTRHDAYLRRSRQGRASRGVSHRARTTRMTCSQPRSSCSLRAGAA